MAMFQNVSELASSLGLISCATAIGAAWVAAIASPNCSFDELDGSRADRHVRELLRQTSAPMAAMMLAAAALFALATSWAAAGTSLVTAFGFFSNRWMLAPRNGKKPKGVRTSRKSQRAMSVSFSLVFTLAAVIAALLGVIGV